MWYTCPRDDASLACPGWLSLRPASSRHRAAPIEPQRSTLPLGGGEKDTALGMHDIKHYGACIIRWSLKSTSSSDHDRFYSRRPHFFLGCVSPSLAVFSPAMKKQSWTFEGAVFVHQGSPTTPSNNSPERKQACPLRRARHLCRRLRRQPLPRTTTRPLSRRPLSIPGLPLAARVEASGGRDLQVAEETSL